MRAGAHRAGNLAHCHHGARAFQPLPRADKFIVHQGQLQAKGGRLGVDAVAAANAGRELEFVRAPLEDRQQRLDIRDQDIGALHHLHGVAGVAHIAAGEAEMKPPAGGVVDFLGDGGGETNHVVVQDLLQFPLAGHQAGQVGEPSLATVLDSGELARGHHLFLHERFAGQQLDLQPEFEFVFVRPDGPHFGAGITRNHGPIKGERAGIKKAEMCAPLGDETLRRHRSTHRRAMRLRAASRTARSRVVRLLMPRAEILSKTASTSASAKSSAGRSAGAAGSGYE